MAFSFPPGFARRTFNYASYGFSSGVPCLLRASFRQDDRVWLSHAGPDQKVVDLWSGTGPNQMWCLEDAPGPPGTFFVRNLFGGAGRYLSVSADPGHTYVDLFTHADGSGRQTWRLQSTPSGGVALYASGREGACGLAYAAQGPPEAQLAPEASQWELMPGRCGGDILGEQNGCPCPRLGFRNPVINQDFADPEAFEDNGTVYFFSTNAGGCNIQVTCTQDYRRFHHMQDALPQLPQWADPGLTWAPSVIKAGGSAEGHPGFRAHLSEALRGSMGGRAPYLMYFVARQHGTGNQVVGVAEAQYPGGPYKPAGRQPLVTQHDKGGTIDPYAIRVGDSLWLLFKSDGNSRGLPCIMSIAPLTPDGLQLAGPATDILRNDLPWEGHVIEAPCLIERNNKFYLFYSGNDYGSQHYAVGVAIAEQVTGPYKKLGEPILRADMGRNVVGPGACSVIRGNHGMDLMAYHSWDAPPPNNKYRAANVASVFWNGDVPSVVATWGQAGLQTVCVTGVDRRPLLQY